MQTKLPQAFCDDNKKAIGMPEIKIITEVAGRVCATPVQVGGTLADGDEIVVVEAMKMEIPVPRLRPARSNRQLGDVVAEGQAHRVRCKLVRVAIKAATI